ncbi:related to phospholipase [Ramularia collo-cygni]|uniref:Related to phospholipase n=1 Tax=Ramularia collo-cygni TaxID=112498 RepID=A0A2D3VGG7_9PEZI|nr:related to phospholipase [Ramularia collo-cygni]CZT19783.1 related to phospholipase [Ramularia collo-cygni]
MLNNDPIITLIESFHELNPNLVEELPAEPNALEFMRRVGQNQPFVVRQAAKQWGAVAKWNASYLRRVLHGKKVRVATTPNGNADAVVASADGTLMFAEPHETEEDFGAFLDYVQQDPGHSSSRNVKYAQPQNDSLRTEYSALFGDVPPDIAFASEGLDQEPDAVNFWLGNDRSTTSLHKDNYENIYVQIRGQKIFTLLAPVEMPCVNETKLPFGRYRPSGGDEQALEAYLNAEGEPMPVPIWDPEQPEERTTAYSSHARPLRVTVNEGDMLYLPAMWYHKVSQGNGAEGFSCSVNYWYDMNFGGSFWSSNAFLRDVMNTKAQEVPYPRLELSSDD